MLERDVDRAAFRMAGGGRRLLGPCLPWRGDSSEKEHGRGGSDEPPRGGSGDPSHDAGPGWGVWNRSMERRTSYRQRFVRFRTRPERRKRESGKRDAVKVREVDQRRELM